MSDVATTYVPAKVGSAFFEGPQDVSPSSASSCCKERLGVKPTYTVDKYDDNDDAGYVVTWKKRLHQLLPLTSVLAIGVYWLYVAFRVKYTLALQRVGHIMFPMAWIFLAVEIGLSLPSLLQQTLQLFSIKSRHRPRLRVVGERVPRVDILITCAGEEVAVIIDTVRAAVDVDWPRDKLRIIILDDKASEEVRREVQLLGLDHPSMHYSARIKTKGVPHHFKAGNLNHGLRYVEGLEGGKAEYVAALDADMIVERCWLRAIVAHLLTDSRLALACPPQLFYNVPKNDPLFQNLAFAFDVQECIKDSLDAAWCTGSGYVVRRSALDQIGGFPTGSVAEDVYCSSLLLGAGWKTCYVHEALQYGMVPVSFSGHIKQRTRWTTGSLQTSARLNFFLFGRVVRGMTLPQRFCGLIFTFDALLKVPLTVSLLLFPILLASGFRLVAYANDDQLRWLLRLAFFSLITNRVDEWIAFVPTSYRCAWRGSLASLWMSPYHAIAIIRSLALPRWLGGKAATFSASGSIDSIINERGTRACASFMRRLKMIWWDSGVLIHVLYLIFLIGAVISSIVRAFTETQDNYQARLIYVLTHTAWPPLIWLVALEACTIPIKYSVSPHAMPDREDLLRRELGTKIAHPIESVKQLRWKRRNILHEGLCVLVSAYVSILFFGSWFF